MLVSCHCEWALWGQGWCHCFIFSNVFHHQMDGSVRKEMERWSSAVFSTCLRVSVLRLSRKTGHKHLPSHHLILPSTCVSDSFACLSVQCISGTSLYCWVGEVANWVRHLPSVHGTHTVEGELTPDSCPLTSMGAHRGAHMFSLCFSLSHS